MKKFRRIILLALMIALSFGGVLTNSLSVVSAYTPPHIGAGIKISKIPTEGSIDSILEIPKGTSDEGDVTLVIKNPRRQVVQSSEYITDTLTEVTFKPTMVGDYTVQYSVTPSDPSTYFAVNSEIYTIKVTGTRPTLNFLENDSLIIPKTIDITQSVELPLPVVKDGEGNVVDDPDISIRVTTPDHTSSVLGAGITTFTPTAELYGTYSVKYTYQDALTGLDVSKTFSIVVEKDYKTNVSDKIDMTFVWKDGTSMPTSGVLGNKIKLPVPVGKDKNQSNAEIEVYTEIEVDFITNGALQDPTAWVSYTVDAENFTFIPMDKTASGGYYRVKYTIVNFFYDETNEATAGSKIERIYSIENVTDTEKPTVYAVEDYDKLTMNSMTVINEETGVNEFTGQDVSYLIPNKVVAGTTVTFPAIYAVDNFVASDELTLKRLIINGTTESNLDTVVDGVRNTNEAVTYTFNVAGTFKVRYEAFDGVNTQRTVVYEIVVVNEGTFFDDVAPRITLPTITDIAFEGDTITFKAPTAIDYATDSLSEVNIVDKNVHLQVFYYLGDDDEDLVEINRLSEDKQYFSFDIPSTSENELTIVVRATDDAQYSGQGTNNTGNVYHTIRIVPISSDTVPPSLELGLPDDFLEYDQNQKINIADLVFEDDDADFVTASITVSDPYGKTVDVRGIRYQLNTSNTNITLSNAYFTSSMHGYYTILVTATDRAGNSVVNAYKVFVNDTLPPVVNPTQNKTVEVGVKVIIPKPVVYDDGIQITNYATTEIEFVGENPSYKFVNATREFTPLEVGTFTFKYIAKDASDNTIESSIITYVAQDSKAPVFEEHDWTPITPLVEIIEEETVTGYEKIEIPYIQATDENGIKEQSVVVKNPEGETILNAVGADLLNSNNNYEFEPTMNGTYTITYKATDKSGKSTTLEKTLAVGDVTPPVLTIGNESANLPSKATVGDTLRLDITTITMTDAQDGTITKDDYIKDTSTKKFVVKITSPSGGTTTLISSNNYSYEFSTSGTYKLVYTLTDDAGNKATRNVDIVVSAADVATSTVEQVWGVVLIVASIALLAGVVLYFVVTNRKQTQQLENERRRENAKKRNDR